MALMLRVGQRVKVSGVAPMRPRALLDGRVTDVDTERYPEPIYRIEDYEDREDREAWAVWLFEHETYPVGQLSVFGG